MKLDNADVLYRKQIELLRVALYEKHKILTIQKPDGEWFYVNLEAVKESGEAVETIIKRYVY